jgi:hypothetical protein
MDEKDSGNMGIHNHNLVYYCNLNDRMRKAVTPGVVQYQQAGGQLQHHTSADRLQHADGQVHHADDRENVHTE